MINQSLIRLLELEKYIYGESVEGKWWNMAMDKAIAIIKGDAKAVNDGMGQAESGIASEAAGLEPECAQPSPAKPCDISVDGLTFNQNDVDNLVAMYNHESFTTPLQESLFRAIKICKERLHTPEPVSVEVCARSLAIARDKLHEDAGQRETCIELSKAVLDAAGVKYGD